MASTTSRKDRPALIDIRYSTFCSAAQNEFLVIANCDIAAGAGDARIAKGLRKLRQRGRLENRVGIDGKEQVSAGEARGLVDRGAAAASCAMADHHIDQALRAGALRYRACVVGRTVVDDDDLQRLQRLPVQGCNGGCEAYPAVESGNDHANGPVVRRRLIAFAQTARAQKRKRNKRECVAGDIEHQRRKGKQQPIGLGEQPHHVQQHRGHPRHRQSKNRW